MALRKRSEKKKILREYSAESLMFRSVTGVFFIALGVLALLSIFAGFRGSVFDVVRGVIQGLGGCLCMGIPVFLIWGGTLLAFSAHRSVPVRSLLFLLIIYLCVLAIINLLSKVGQEPLMDYIVLNNQSKPLSNPDGFANVFTAIYRLCYANGMFGGALGGALSWLFWTYVGTVAGVAILGILCLTCTMMLSRLDIIGWFRDIRERTDAKLEEREAYKQQRLYEQQLEYQREQEAYALATAYNQPDQPQDGITAEPIAGSGSVMYPAGLYTNGTISPMGTPVVQPGGNPTVMFQAPYVQPAGPKATLYNEDILPGTQEKLSWWQKGYGKKTGKTDSPDPQEAQNEANAGAALNRNAMKAAERLEEIRKRKTELAQRMNEQETDGNADEPAMNFTYHGTSVANAPHTSDLSPYQRGGASETPHNHPHQSTDIPQPASAAPKRSTTASSYVYPPIDLLNTNQQPFPDTRSQDASNAERLENTLDSFGITARVQRITHGPAVTRFELGLTSSGVNVKRITNIADTIALQLAANGKVRIEIPIPGTNLFGIEIPNKEIMSVSLAEVLVSPEMRNAKAPLAVGLGHDIAGRPIICDLAQMPHLLIAGQTGSGKSMCINAIINSILFRSPPEEVRMILIDPKVVELQCYNVVPHLLTPVISDPQKASGALAWAVAEMLDRYHKLKSKNVRELGAYNAKLGSGEEKIPRIIIVIDELSDLMLACKREVEESIIRIAQLARAAGIHLIVATQRPTVDVITGLIKANIPSRISFAVSSSIDSRTILDMNGAENLLGKGDMLYCPTNATAPTRVQGCFLSDIEIENVVDHIGKYTSVEFDPSIIEALDAESGSAGAMGDLEDDGVDEKLQEAIEMVIYDGGGQASISMLQRRMKIGYARAGRLIDEMAARGVVSKSAGSKAREVLMAREEYERIKDSILR